MKKLIGFVIVAGLLVGGWYTLRSQRSLLEEPGKVGVVTEGVVTLPITASCVSKEARRVQIKSKASGTIIAIPVDEGDLVKKGDLLIRIDPVDEQRNLNRAQMAVRAAEANREQLRLEADRRESSVVQEINRAKASLESAKAKYEYADSEFKAIEELYHQKIETPREYTRAMTQRADALSAVATAESNLKTAELGPMDVEIAKARVKVADAELDARKEERDDAERRLEETEIRSPIDGRVVAVTSSEGLVIASTVGTFGGGQTLLELVDTEDVVVEAQVDEADIDRVNELLTRGQRIREGVEKPPTGDGDETAEMPDEVEVKFDALPDAKFKGLLVDIAQEPQDIANIITYDVRVRLLESDELPRVRLGMQGTVEFEPNMDEGLRVPYSAVHREGPNDFVVYVPTSPELRDEKPIEVTVGLSDGADVIVKDTELKVGDEVYTKRPKKVGRADKDEQE